MTEQSSQSNCSKNGHASESHFTLLANRKNKRGNLKFTYTHQIEQTGNSHSVKRCTSHVSAQTTSSVVSLVFEILQFGVLLLFVCCLLIFFPIASLSLSSLYLLFPLAFFFFFIFFVFVFLCFAMTRLGGVHRDPSFLFPKAPKRAEAVSVAFSPKFSKAGRGEAREGYHRQSLYSSSKSRMWNSHPYPPPKINESPPKLVVTE